jgi:hypothetical protein
LLIFMPPGSVTVYVPLFFALRSLHEQAISFPPSERTGQSRAPHFLILLQLSGQG